MTRYLLQVLFLFVALSTVNGQDKFVIRKDLQDEWMGYGDNGFERLENTRPLNRNTIYFRIDTRHYGGDYLRILSDKNFFLFINGTLVDEYAGEVVLNLDSLSRVSQTSVCLFAIHQRPIYKRTLKTAIVTRNPPAHPVAEREEVKPATFLRDFVIVSGLLLAIFFIAVVQASVRSFSGYFSALRMFLLKEAGELHAHIRLMSRSNVLYYVYCSFMIGFYFLVIFHHLPDQYTLPLYFRITGFWSAVGQWIKLSVMVLGLFLSKVILIYLLTRLFGMRGLAGVHFFTWIRYLIITVGSFSVFLFLYFISHGQRDDIFVIFLSVVIVALTIWVAIAFFRLSSRSGHSMFHLFSYICATELIPLFVTIKVFFR